MNFETQNPRVIGCITVGLVALVGIGLWTVGNFLMEYIPPSNLYAAAIILFVATILVWIWKPNAGK